MSWLSKAVKSVAKVVKKVAKPVEKILRPVIRTGASIIPGGTAVLDAHKALKNAIYDPLRRGGEEAAAVVQGIEEQIDLRVNAAGAAVQSVNAAQNFQYQVSQNPFLVIGALALVALALGFGRR